MRPKMKSLRSTPKYSSTRILDTVLQLDGQCDVWVKENHVSNDTDDVRSTNDIENKGSTVPHASHTDGPQVLSANTIDPKRIEQQRNNPNRNYSGLRGDFCLTRDDVVVVVCIRASTIVLGDADCSHNHEDDGENKIDDIDHNHCSVTSVTPKERMAKMTRLVVVLPDVVVSLLNVGKISRRGTTCLGSG